MPIATYTDATAEVRRQLLVALPDLAPPGSAEVRGGAPVFTRLDEQVDPRAGLNGRPWHTARWGVTITYHDANTSEELETTLDAFVDKVQGALDPSGNEDRVFSNLYADPQDRDGKTQTMVVTATWDNY